MQTNSEQKWPRVAVMGAGAVGCYFGGMLARAGVPVTLVGRRALAEVVAREGLFLDSVRFQERVAVAVSTQADAVREADVVLFCVKTLDTAEAARQIAPHLKPGALVVSMQNGVENVETIRAASGIEAVPSVVYVAASVPAPGHVKHAGRGDLAVGHAQRKGDVARIVELFARAGVPCRISENVEGDLWAKLVWNCAGNALTALARASYGRIAGHELGREVLINTAKETLEVARAAGVQMPPLDLVAGALKLAQDLGDATSSTAQDMERGKLTEIDSLNGYVVRRGAELGVPTPVNFTLYALVKLLEGTAHSGSS